jgi:hypothetical protein
MANEYLKPVSWIANGWTSLISNVDEPWQTPDGSTIGYSTVTSPTGAACTIDFSDVQDIRNGIDEITGLSVLIRAKGIVGTPELYVYLKKFGNTLSYYTLPFPPTVNYQNKAIFWVNWNDAFAGTDTAPINSLQMQLVLNQPGVEIEIDTISISVSYIIPPDVYKYPEEATLNLRGKVPPITRNDFVRPTEDTLDLTLYDSEMLRADTIYPGPRFLLLNTASFVLDSPFDPVKTALTLSGKVPVLSQKRTPAADSVTLAGKVPDDIAVSEHQVITFPLTYINNLFLQGQEVGDEDTVLPSRGRAYLTGKKPTVERNWVVTPAASALQVGEPPHVERIWPESWEPGEWLGDITNIDEPPDEPDGLVISIDQPSKLANIYFSDVQRIRDGVDRITGVKPTFRVRAAAGVVGDESPSIKLWSYVFINDIQVSIHKMSIIPTFVTYELPEFTYGTGTETGPINSMYMKWAIYDTAVTAEIDLISFDVIYDRVSTTEPTLDSGHQPGKVPVTLTGRALEVLDSGRSPPAETLALTGKTPVISQGFAPGAGQLRLLSDTEKSPASAELSLTGQAPIIRSIVPSAGSLTLIGKAPSTLLATVLPPGDHGIMSLTSNYEIEHIATPSEDIEL